MNRNELTAEELKSYLTFLREQPKNIATDIEILMIEKCVEGMPYTYVEDMVQSFQNYLLNKFKEENNK